jgi:hypothetical protein
LTVGAVVGVPVGAALGVALGAPVGAVGVAVVGSGVQLLHVNGQRSLTA